MTSQIKDDGVEAVLMALGSLCGATGYFQWEAAVLSRKIELSANIDEVPIHELNLLRLAQRRASMDVGYEIMHYSDNIMSTSGTLDK